jgi:hypothetical protein
MYFHPHQQGFFPNQEMPMNEVQDFRQFPGGGYQGGYPGGGFPGGGFPGGGQTDRRLDRLEREVQRLDRRLDRVEQRLDRIERRLGIRDNNNF